MLEIKNVSKRYGKFYAVKNLNLNIEDGEIFGFLGPNGAGKTTTIKMMSGLTSITEGDIFINNISIKKNPIEYKKQIALIPDKPYIFEKLKGIEYLYFIANLYDVPKQKFEILCNEYIEKFEIKNYINDFIESYSHGMCQKLLIVASLIHEPKVFILDEPMVGLDPKSMKILSAEFKELSKKGTIIFMSTHSLDVAENICTKVGIIDNGQLLAVGKISELKENLKEKNLEDIFFKLTDNNDKRTDSAHQV